MRYSDEAALLSITEQLMAVEHCCDELVRAQRLNEDSSKAVLKVRLGKFLFPHGCLCWRECPDCGKLSAFHGDEWNVRSASLIPPPPLAGFDRRGGYPSGKNLDPEDRLLRAKEIEAWDEGRRDARACLHCDTLSTAEHTQTVMQSSFKQAVPSFIDEVQRDLRALVMKADHIILMGYSLPLDDVSYRAFFAARRQRGNPGNPVRCTIVDKNDKFEGMYPPNELNLADFPSDSVVHSACAIFGAENVRYCGEGIPEAFCTRSGPLSDAKLQRIFHWSNSRSSSATRHR